MYRPVCSLHEIVPSIIGACETCVASVALCAVYVFFSVYLNTSQTIYLFPLSHNMTSHPRIQQLILIVTTVKSIAIFLFWKNYNNILAYLALNLKKQLVGNILLFP